MPTTQFNLNTQFINIPIIAYIYNSIARYEAEHVTYINLFKNLSLTIANINYIESRTLKKLVHDSIFHIYTSCNCICCESLADAITDIGLSVLKQFNEVSLEVYPIDNNIYQNYLQSLINEAKQTINKMISISCQCRKKIIKTHTCIRD